MWTEECKTVNEKRSVADDVVNIANHDIKKIAYAVKHTPFFLVRYAIFDICAMNAHCVSIAFSIHLDAYVASRTPFDESKLEMPLIRPIVPMEIRSSASWW